MRAGIITLTNPDFSEIMINKFSHWPNEIYNSEYGLVSMPNAILEEFS